MINNNHPSYEDFVKNEIKTLGFLREFSTLASMAPNLTSDATTMYYILSNKDSRNTEFIFNSGFPLIIEGAEHIVIVEAIVRPGFKECSYVLSIAKDENGSKILRRKFHFDYAPTNNQDDNKSIYHLQYGGKTTPKLTELEIDVEPMYPYLSPPRIPILPTNLGLILDFVFCEFPSVETNRVIESRLWRDFVKNNEQQIYNDYFSNIYQFFNGGRHKSNMLFRDLRFAPSEQ